MVKYTPDEWNYLRLEFKDNNNNKKYIKQDNNLKSILKKENNKTNKKIKRVHCIIS